MTFVYEVRSDVPLALTIGIGNTVIVSPHSMYSPLIVRDVVQSNKCGPQCRPANLTLELKEKP
jgi:hypothetical protein